MWLEITPRKGKSFLIGSFYRNPTEKAEWLDRFEVLIEHVLLENKEIIILGDFNKDLLNLNVNKEWSNFITSFGLSQLITEPTRVTNNSKTLIDHIYVSHEEKISSASVKKLGISDHFAIACNRKNNFNPGKNLHKEIKYRTFKTFDENAFLNDLFIHLGIRLNPLIILMIFLQLGIPFLLQ